MMQLRFQFCVALIDQDWTQPLVAFCYGDRIDLIEGFREQKFF